MEIYNVFVEPKAAHILCKNGSRMTDKMGLERRNGPKMNTNRHMFATEGKELHTLHGTDAFFYISIIIHR